MKDFILVSRLMKNLLSDVNLPHHSSTLKQQQLLHFTQSIFSLLLLLCCVHYPLTFPTCSPGVCELMVLIIFCYYGTMKGEHEWQVYEAMENANCSMLVVYLSCIFHGKHHLFLVLLNYYWQQFRVFLTPPHHMWRQTPSAKGTCLENPKFQTKERNTKLYNLKYTLKAWDTFKERNYFNL